MGTTSLEFQSLLYRTAEDNLEIDALLKDDTIWMTQKAMGQLFGCSTDNIGLHLKNIFQDEELVKDSVTEKISATASDGKKYLTNFYNLDAIISVGYRVNSKKATNFRIWATGVPGKSAIRKPWKKPKQSIEPSRHKTCRRWRSSTSPPFMNWQRKQIKKLNKKKTSLKILLRLTVKRCSKEVFWYVDVVYTATGFL